MVALACILGVVLVAGFSSAQPTNPNIVFPVFQRDPEVDPNDAVALAFALIDVFEILQKLVLFHRHLQPLVQPYIEFVVQVLNYIGTVATPDVKRKINGHCQKKLNRSLYPEVY